MSANPVLVRTTRLPSWYQPQRLPPKALSKPNCRRKRKPEAASQITDSSLSTKKAKKNYERQESTQYVEIAHNKMVTDEDFRVTSSWNQVHPVGIKNSDVPLTPLQSTRLLGWSWGNSWGSDEVSLDLESPSSPGFREEIEW